MREGGREGVNKKGVRECNSHDQCCMNKVPCFVGKVTWQLRLCWLGGDFEECSHWLELGPWRLCHQHLHNSTPCAPTVQ